MTTSISTDYKKNNNTTTAKRGGYEHNHDHDMTEVNNKRVDRGEQQWVRQRRPCQMTRWQREGSRASEWPWLNGGVVGYKLGSEVEKVWQSEGHRG